MVQDTSAQWNTPSLNFSITAPSAEFSGNVSLQQSSKILATMHKDGQIEIFATEQELKDFSIKYPMSAHVSNMLLEILRLRARCAP